MRHGMALVTSFAIALTVAACSSASNSGGSRNAPTPPPASSPASPTSSVLSAYRRAWTAYEQALAGANAYDPALAETMADPLLQHVRAYLLSDHNAGIVGRGSIQLNPRVASLTQGRAVVVDCSFSRSELVYAKTGSPVPPVTPPEHDFVRATLTKVAQTWKVTQQSVTEGSCPSGT